MDLCNGVDTHLARTIPRICATNKFDAQIHGNVRRCGAGLSIALADPNFLTTQRLSAFAQRPQLPEASRRSTGVKDLSLGDF